jgi:hypothetical protein
VLYRQDQGGLEARDQERVRTFKELLIKYMNSIEDAFLLVIISDVSFSLV